MITIHGCGSETKPAPLTNSSGSIEETVYRAIREIREADDVGLRELLITRYEHDSVIAPYMKDSTRLATFDFDLAWQMLTLGRNKGILRAIEDFGPDSLTVLYVNFREEPEVYGDLTLRQGTRVTLRNETTGEEFESGIFGSIVEINGRFKMISIRD